MPPVCLHWALAGPVGTRCEGAIIGAVRLSAPWRRALAICLLWAFRVSGQEAAERPSLEQQSATQTDAHPFELVLEATSPCPEARALREKVIRLASVGPETSGGLVAHVTIQSVGQARWSLTMRTEQNGLQGERTLEGPSCRAVADAAALTLALMLNPEAQQPSTADAPSLPPRRPGRVRPRPTRRPSPQLASRQVVVAGTAHVGLHVGALPTPGPELSLGIAGGRGRGSVWLLGSYAPPQEKLLEQDRGGRLWMLAVAAVGCWQLTRGAPNVRPCVGAAFNRIQGRGIHIDYPRSGTVYWVSPTAGALADVPLGSWLAIRAAALGQVPLARPVTYIEGTGPVHRPSLAEARLLGGLLIGPR